MYHWMVATSLGARCHIELIPAWIGPLAFPATGLCIVEEYPSSYTRWMHGLVGLSGGLLLAALLIYLDRLFVFHEKSLAFDACLNYFWASQLVYSVFEALFAWRIIDLIQFNQTGAGVAVVAGVLAVMVEMGDLAHV